MGLRARIVLDSWDLDEDLRSVGTGDRASYIEEGRSASPSSIPGQSSGSFGPGPPASSGQPLSGGPSYTQPTYNPPQLSPQQMQVLLLHLTGWPNWRIAAQMGLTDPRISQILGSVEVQQALRDARAQVVSTAGVVMAKLQSEALNSLNTIVYIRDHARHDHNKLAAAKDILDRAGHKPVERKIVQSTHHIASDDMERMRETLHQDTVIDAEFTKGDAACES